MADEICCGLYYFCGTADMCHEADAPASKREGLRRFVELMYAALDDDGDGDQG
jgi:hypothetical protein